MHASANPLRCRKQLVESCLSLDTKLLLQRRILVPGFRRSGTFYWMRPTGERVASLDYESEMIHPAISWLRLRFSTPDLRTGQSRQVDQFVPLTSTDPGFGEVRYWFVDEGRRVGLLYLPSDVALDWMLKAAASVGLKYEPTLLRLHPDPTGPQHDETKSSLFKYAGKKLRDIKPFFPLH